MIISVWKPHSKYINRKRVFTHYELVETKSIYNSGTTAYKVIWKCDSEECKYKNKIHSINRHHLNVNRSKFCYENLQICKSCQTTGNRNPRFGDNRSWDQIMGKEKSDKIKQKYKINFTLNNPSKLENVKIKKGQLIITKESINKIITDSGFKLIRMIGHNKMADLEIKCPNNHIYQTKYTHWKRGYRCKRCFYDTLKVDIDDIDRFEKYSKKVRLLTAITYRNNKNLIDPDNKKSKEYHLDHIYSIADGFKNDVEPKVIASMCNLRIIDAKENLQKGIKSDITLESLLNLFNKYIQ